MKILFLCKKRLAYSGVSVGLSNSANFVVNFLNSRGVEAKLEFVTDGNDIDRVVTNYNPTHVIIEALWATPQKINELLNIPRHKSRLWIVRLHSKPAFLSGEGMAFEWLLGYRSLELDNLIIAPNVSEFTEDLADFGLRVAYLPNIYNPPIYQIDIKQEYDRSIDIGCFGAIRPFKNHLTQAIGAVKFANYISKNLNFHINGDRLEQSGSNSLKNVRAFFKGQSRHNLVEHTWKSHEDFVQMCAGMDLGLQVSLTETFNIVTADMITACVPVVVSDQINWIPKEARVNDPNSTSEIAERLFHVYRHRQGVLNRSDYNLRLANLLAEQKWTSFLRRVK